MRPLDEFIHRQLERARQNARFLALLDPARTVLLADILRDRSITPLGAPWLRHDLFVELLTSAIAWIDALPLSAQVQGMDGCQLIFFQRACAREDAAEHAERSAKYENFGAVHGTLPPQVFALHTHTRFLWSLRATTTGHIVEPQRHFSGKRGRCMIDDHPDIVMEDPGAIGYRVPDYPALLGVSDEIATAYLARMVVHDLGHGALPDIGEPEELHNAVMLAAMDAPLIRAATPWERLVRDECTDPLFFLECVDRANEILRTDPLREAFLATLMEFHPCDPAVNERLWDIPPGTPLERAREQVTQVIAEMPAERFIRYTERAKAM